MWFPMCQRGQEDGGLGRKRRLWQLALETHAAVKSKVDWRARHSGCKYRRMGAWEGDVP